MREALLCAFEPVGKTVAVALAALSALMIWLVVPELGPSSNVRAT